MDRLLLLGHAGATFALLGLIWTVQVVHYPLFERVGSDRRGAYHAGHQTRITWIVGPLMVAELATAVLLVLRGPAGVPTWMPLVSAALVGVVWASTALVQVPLHAGLERGWDAGLHARLAGTNWIRTAAWTARALLVGGMVWQWSGPA